MKPIPLALAALATLFLALPADAQIYQWKDANGKTVISDKPPSSNVAVEKKAATAPVPAAAQKSLADRDLEFRKRQKEQQESAEKSAKDEKAQAERKENCEKSRRYLQLLESGQRLATQDDKGERVFMEDEQRRQEIEKTRQNVESQCNAK